MNEKEFHTQILPLSGMLYRIAFYILEDRQLAEDAVQEAYLRLWDSRESLDKVLNLKGYCAAMVRNICIDRIRKARKLELPAELPEVEQQQDDIDNKERLAMALDAIKSLPDRQREVLLLRTVEGLSYEEISARTGVGEMSLRVILSRARQTLKNKL